MNNDADNSRRTFFARLSIILSGVIGAIITLPGVSYMLAPVFSKPKRVWQRVTIPGPPPKPGRVEDFTVGQTDIVRYEDPSPEAWAGVTAETGAWLRRVGEEEFIAFSINCRHLGCPVRWEEGPRLFMCPCHGGVYYPNGDVAAGPPPEPLHRYPVRVKDGYVEIETSPIPLTTNEPV